jgi:hypothetical protein
MGSSPRRLTRLLLLSVGSMLLLSCAATLHRCQPREATLVEVAVISNVLSLIPNYRDAAGQRFLVFLSASESACDKMRSLPPSEASGWEVVSPGRCKRERKTGCLYDRHTGRQGLKVSLGEVGFIATSTNVADGEMACVAQVNASLYVSPQGAEAYQYRLVRKDGMWAIVERLRPGVL